MTLIRFPSSSGKSVGSVPHGWISGKGFSRPGRYFLPGIQRVPISTRTGWHQYEQDHSSEMNILLTLLAIVVAAGGSQSTAGRLTLTVVVENVNKDDGNIGVLVFNSSKVWPEDRFVALKEIVLDAHLGTCTMTVPELPASEYA